MKYDLILHENLVDVDLIKDYFKIAQTCRESYYHLESLKHHCEEVAAEDTPSQVCNFLLQVQDFRQRFLMNDVACTHSHNDYIIPPEFCEVEADALYQKVKNNLTLICQMDKLQIEILGFLINYCRRKSKNLVKEEPLLEEIYRELEAEYFLEIMFFHSSDENKIANYKLDTKKTDIKKDLKGENISLPEYFKLSDYSFLVNKRRTEYKHWRRAYMELLRVMPKLKQEKNLNIIAEKQFTYNKHITYLTYLVAILTVIMALFTFLSTYFGVLDHWETVMGVLNRKL